MASYQRYLEVKRSIDDRSLNQHVFRSLLDNFATKGRPRVLELGSGIGTMVARGIEWGLLERAEYTAIDLDPDNLAYARTYLGRWGRENGFCIDDQGQQSIVLTKGEKEITVLLRTADALGLVKESSEERWDLLIAHLFLDLVDITKNLGPWIELLRPKGIFYFSLVFDGSTVLRPVIDPELDERLLSIYYQNMERKLPAGSSYHPSETGRLALDLLLDMDEVEVIDVGCSDWIICPCYHRYTSDETAFLEYMIQIISGAVREERAADEERIDEWARKRREQLACDRLIYMAHQIDIVGSVKGPRPV